MINIQFDDKVLTQDLLPNHWELPYTKKAHKINILILNFWLVLTNLLLIYQISTSSNL